jgi:hypothetical protein
MRIVSPAHVREMTAMGEGKQLGALAAGWWPMGSGTCSVLTRLALDGVEAPGAGDALELV